MDDQVLNDEGTGEAASFPCARTVLVPGLLLVEHDVVRDKHLVFARVIEPVCLGTLRVAQETIGVLLSSSLVRISFVFLTWPM